MKAYIPVSYTHLHSHIPFISVFCLFIFKEYYILKFDIGETPVLSGSHYNVKLRLRDNRKCEQSEKCRTLLEYY